MEKRENLTAFSCHHEVLSGSILWLRPKYQCDSRLLVDLDIDDGCFNHPVVVLSANPKQATATVLLLTSLRGIPLEDKYPTNPYFRHHHLPLFPTAAHPDYGLQLFLEDGRHLRRESYVKTEWQYEVHWALLNSYDGSGAAYRLHSVSRRDLTLYLRVPFVHPSPLSADLAPTIVSCESAADSGSGLTRTRCGSDNDGEEMPR